MKPKKKRYKVRSLSAILTFFLSLLFIVNIPAVSFAQNKIEQLEQKLQTLSNDTAKVNVLLTLGEEYCSKENDKALMYLQEAFTIATSLNYTSGIGKSLLWQGRVYYYKDDYPLSNNYLDKAKAVLETTDDLDALAFTYYAKAINCRIRGDYIHASEMFKAAIQLTEKTENLKLMSSCYSGIGVILLDRKEPRKALEYFRETLGIKESIDDQMGMANALTCIGISYEEIGEMDSSLIVHKQALAIRTRLALDRAVAGSEYQIGGVLIKMGKYEDAEKSLQIAISNFSKLEEKTGIIISKLRLAIAQNKQGKPNAVQHALDALEIANKIDNPSLISHAYKILSEIYAFNNDYKQSYQYLIKHQTIHDSIFDTEKERILTEFETKFQSEKKDNEISLLKSKTEGQEKFNILLIVLVIVFAGVIVLLFFLFRLKSTAFNRQQMLREKENIIHAQELKINEKENQILQEQLESKNRELASKALEMLRYNETISSIIEKLESLNIQFDEKTDVMRPIKDIIHELENHTKQNIWNEFEKIFKNIHSGFYEKLLEICPELTATEIKTAALLKLNLTTKEIAAIAFKSEGGIKTTRYRLRKKLGLSGDDKLVPFLMQI